MRGIWNESQSVGKPRRVRDENDQAAKDGECLEQDVQTSGLRQKFIPPYATHRRSVVVRHVPSRCCVGPSRKESRLFTSVFSTYSCSLPQRNGSESAKAVKRENSYRNQRQSADAFSGLSQSISLVAITRCMYFSPKAQWCASCESRPFSGKHQPRVNSIGTRQKCISNTF